MKHGYSQKHWPPSLLKELSEMVSHVLHVKRTSPIHTVVISGREAAAVASWLEQRVVVHQVLTYYLATNDTTPSDYVTLTSKNDPKALDTALAQKGLMDRESILIIHLVNEANIQPVQWFESWVSFVNSTGMIVLAAHQVSQFAAADWLLAAANSGLIPNADGCYRYPDFPSIVEFSLLNLQQRSYHIRHPDKSDLSALVELERLCWPAPIAMPDSILSQRITEHPAEQLVLLDKQMVEGVVYSQRIRNIEVLDQAQGLTVHEHYDANGRTVQLLALNVLPALQAQGLGGALLEFALQWMTLQDVDVVVGVTRWSNYKENANLSPEAYLLGKNEHGDPLDPVLHMHKKHGAEIKKLLPEYRPKDADNKGYGVLVQYDLGKRISKQLKTITTKPTEAMLIEQAIETAIFAFVADDKKHLFMRNTPLMDLGIESLSLLKLINQLSKIFNEELPATFLFQYGNTQAVIDYFIESRLYRYYGWLYGIEFRSLPVPHLKDFHKGDVWLIFVDEKNSFAPALIEALELKGQRWISVCLGPTFQAFSDHEYQLRLEKNDFIRLFQALEDKSVVGVCYLWGLISDVPAQPDISYFQRYHHQVCGGLVYLVQGMYTALFQKSPRLWVMTWAEQKRRNAKSLVIVPLEFLCNAVIMEHPELKCCRISLDSQDTVKNSVQKCLQEFSAEDDQDQIFWLGKKRYSPRLIHLKLPTEIMAPQLNAEASYLIAGGCGGLGSIGLYVAKWHVAHGAKYLILLDPKPISRESQVIIDSFKAQGVHVEIHILDITKFESLSSVFAEAQKTLPPIKGIMHVLGLVDDDRLVNMTWERFEKVLQYKVPVAWHLHSLSKSLELDHFILFSGIGPILGPKWRASRISANAFLGALAHYRASMGLPALAIDWGPWSASTTATDPMYESNLPMGLNKIDAEQGMKILNLIYALPMPQIVVADIDWIKMMRGHLLNRPLLFDIQSDLGIRSSEIMMQLEGLSTDKQLQIITSYLIQHIRRVLSLPVYIKVSATKTFQNLKLDTLRFHEFEQNIQYDLTAELQIPNSIFTEQDTIAGAAEKLLACIHQAKTSEQTEPHILIKHEATSQEPIAIIGMACQFPGAKNYMEFWDNLVNQIDSIREIPSDRWDWRAIYGDPKKDPNKTNIKWGGFIDDIDKFDPLFFNISPKEADYMDPQHRLFLQTAWHAMEDAGYSSKMLAGKKVGVYAGVSKNDYSELMRENHEQIQPYISTGTVHSILSNRVSYILDLHGPSESIDTACSSALVALHSAIRDIRNGECSLAFVGGVNALLSSTMYISHTRSGFLSEDGHCKTFDASANGYVRGEGVGVLLLKPLRDAQKDGDFIHAIIRGAAVNHGGKSTNLTAPNITSQAEVIQYALKDADADPRTITYVEVHGTGTPLGDPVEIEGLKKAFARGSSNSVEEKYCVLGAVKTNIGHCESAAGVASIFKMILAMKHHAIPANLHFKTLNPKVDLEKSPFSLATTYQNWNPVDRENRPLPRRGGISSFGMGGVNTHVILEEAPAQEIIVKRSLRKLLVPISAKKGRLIDYVIELRGYLDRFKQNQDQVNLDSIAYTLQTGRDAYEERVIFIVNSVSELSERISNFLNNESHKDIYYSPSAKQNSYNESTQVERPEIVAEQWIQGERINWNLYWEHTPPRYSGLPGYPFKLLRCWFEGKSIIPVPIDAESTVTDTMDGTKIEMAIRSSRFFLKDHIVKGKSIMPGVMYLEIARGAAEKIQSGRVVNAIHDVNWVLPLEVMDDLIHVTVILEGEELSRFRILEKGILKCSGKLIYNKKNINPERIDINKVINELPHQISEIELYEKMKMIGLSQGPSFRVLKLFWSNQQSGVGKLQLSPSENLKEFTLHPSLMDGVFQTVVMHHFREHNYDTTQYVPFSLQSVEWFMPLESELYAYVEELEESEAGHVLKYRMRIVNLSGEVIVQFEGFYKRPLSKIKRNYIEPLKESSPPLRDIYYTDFLEENKCVENRKLSEYLLLLSGDEELRNALSKKLPTTKIIWISTGTVFEKHSDYHYVLNPGSINDFHDLLNELKDRGIVLNEIVYAWNIYDLKPILFLTKSLMQNHSFRDLIILYLYASTQELNDAQYAMAAGFARTLIYENPRMELRSIETGLISQEERASILVTEFKTHNSSPLLEVSYINGIRKERKIVPADEIENFETHDCLLKNGGNYLITGGAGGLGKIFSKYLADHYHANLILVGRSKINDSIQRTIDTLKSTAGSVYYLSADVTNLKSLQTAFLTLPQTVQTINGVIHAAGLKNDSFILKKEEDSFNQVINTKVKGALALDELTKDMKLDFMLLFSSIAALIPNQGQSDYASANSFLDRFSHMRNVLVRNESRSGFTLSINWPLWKSGGMQVTSEQEQHLQTVFGMNPLSTEMGLRTFENLLNYAHESENKHDHIIVISGNKLKIMSAFDGEDRTSISQDETVISVKPETPSEHRIAAEEREPVSEKMLMNSTSDVSTTNTSEELEKYLKETISSVLGIHSNELNSDTDFEQYGINSIVITEINAELEKRFKGLPKTLFFEYPNLRELIEYFIKESNGGQIFTDLKPPSIIPTKTSSSDKNYPLVDQANEGAEYSTTVKEFTPDLPYVKGFSHQGKSAVPGACFLEMAREGGALLYPDHVIISVFNNYWPVPLEIEGEKIETRTKLIPFSDSINFEISSQSPDHQEIIHATGSLSTHYRFPKPSSVDINSKIAKALTSIKSEAFYEIIHENADLRLAGLFRPVQELHLLEGEGIAHLVFPDETCFEKNVFVIQPVIMTGIEQSLLVYTALTHAEFHPQGMRLMPVSIEAVDIYAAFTSRCFLHFQAKKASSVTNKIQRFDATLFDESGNVLAFISGNTMRISPLDIKETTIEETTQATDIAIIGMSGRFPDANNLEEYWNNLVAGKDSISDHPMHQDLYHSGLADQEEGILSCKFGASVQSVDTFAPEFFGIAPIEGALIDPQERLFLQVAWEALQDAGWDPKKMSVEERKIGVFVGVIWQDYQLIALEETLKGDPVVASSLLYSIANRLSYTFNFTGPSLSVDTACSSSLTALHLACQSIWLGEIRSAIVGGVNLNLHPMKYAFLNNYSFLSSEGKCRSYGEGGDGYVPGEGVGALLIKSLKEAIKDGDPIYAVIKGSAINHGGKTRGYTVPNPVLQSEVISSAIERAKINPRDISYVEGHGTGTALGDPVEIRGLDLAYSKFTSDKQYCAIGSVKSNIGHLEAAAGIASIIKVILQMEQNTLVPSLHSEILNKNIDFSNTPFKVQRVLEPWKSEHPFLAAVSSFGAGGSYAHVILEKYGESRKISRPTLPLEAQHYYIEQKSIRGEVKSESIDHEKVAFDELGKALEHTENKEKIIEDHLIRYLKIALKFPDNHHVDSKQGFFEMGMNSLIAVQLVNMMQISIGNRCKIDATSTFDYPSIDKLTEYLSKLMGFQSVEKGIDAIDEHVNKLSLDELLKEAGEEDDE